MCAQVHRVYVTPTPEDGIGLIGWVASRRVPGARGRECTRWVAGPDIFTTWPVHYERQADAVEAVMDDGGMTEKGRTYDERGRGVDLGELTKIANEAEELYGSPRRGWLIADTALRLAPWGTGRMSAEDQMRPLAEATSLSTATLDSYRRVAYSWPENMRDELTTFSTYMILYHPKYKDLLVPGMTTGQANKARKKADRMRAAEQAEVLGEVQESRARAAERIQHMVQERSMPAVEAPAVSESVVTVELPQVEELAPVIELPEPVKPLAERVFDVAQRIEEAMVEDGPDEAAIMVDALMDILDMEQVTRVADQLRSRVRWASTRR